MRVLIFTAMHERHLVSELWCKGISRFIKAAPEGIICEVLAVVTHAESCEICNRYGIRTVMEKNEPLGNKFNKGLEFGLLNLDWDYTLIMGDDDLISNEAWQHYLPLMEQGEPYFGFRSIYFYEPKLRKALTFDYKYSAAGNKLIGCGRMISRDAVKRSGYVQDVMFRHDVNYGGAVYGINTRVTLPEYRARYFIGMRKAIQLSKVYFGLWRKDQNKSLDNESEVRLLMNGYCPVAIDVKQPLLTDVKTENNIWSFLNYNIIAKPVRMDEVVRFLGDDEKDWIRAKLGGR